MKKIVLITYHFPPAGGGSTPASKRLGKFTKYLPNFGWDPVVITIGENDIERIDNSLLSLEQNDVIRISDPLKKIINSSRLSSLLPNIVLQIPWAIKILIRSKNIFQKEKPFLIMASSPPPITFFVGFVLRRLYNVPLVLDYRDQWTLSPYRRGPKIYKLWDYWLEKKILNNSNLVLVTNKNRLMEHNEYWNEFSPETVIIPNGFDIDDFNLTCRNYKMNGSDAMNIVLRHVGNIYGPRVDTINNFLQKLSLLMGNSFDSDLNITVQQVGNRPKRLVEDNISENLKIEYLGSVNYKNALKLELGADILLLIVGAHSQSNSEITSKIYEYLATGRPIVVLGQSSILGELTQEIERVTYIDEKASAEDLDSFIKWCVKNNKGVTPENACDELLLRFPNHEIRKITEKLASHIDKVVKKDD